MGEHFSDLLFAPPHLHCSVQVLIVLPLEITMVFKSTLQETDLPNVKIWPFHSQLKLLQWHPLPSNATKGSPNSFACRLVPSCLIPQTLSSFMSSQAPQVTGSSSPPSCWPPSGWMSLAGNFVWFTSCLYLFRCRCQKWRRKINRRFCVTPQIFSFS